VVHKKRCNWQDQTDRSEAQTLESHSPFEDTLG